MSDSPSASEPDFEQLRETVERLLDETVDREEPMTVDVEDLAVSVPTRFGEGSPRARWRFDGQVTVTVDGIRQPLREWLELYDQSADGRAD